jgi:hypothetical protein
MRRITEIEPLDNARLRLRYSTGEEIRYDVRPLINQGGIWSALGDPDFFRKVALGEGGRFITWPGELDLCADAIYLESQRARQHAV